VKGRRIFAVAIAGIIALVAALILGPHENEPEYNGRKLSEWLHFYRFPDSAPWPKGSDQGNAAFEARRRDVPIEARKAIQHIGTNAIPFLIQRIGAKHTTQSRIVWHAIKWKPTRWAISPLERHLVRTAEATWEAVSGFEILGETASAAVPDLTRLLDSNDFAGQFPPPVTPPPAAALLFIGKPGLPPVLRYAANPTNAWRNMVVRSLCSAADRLGTNAVLLLPTLIAGLSDPNNTVACSCAQALGRINAEPELVVPALIKAMNGTVQSLVVFAIQALRSKGPAAKAAVPDLLKLRDDPNPTIRDAVEAALMEIEGSGGAARPVKDLQTR
jgi:hypothetical protein